MYLKIRILKNVYILLKPGHPEAVIKPEKKASKDIHAVFSFRLSPEEKGSLSREVESIRGRLNKRRADTEKLIKKHDVILAALKKGLTALKSEAGEK